jgi:hypothetical protein
MKPMKGEYVASIMSAIAYNLFACPYVADAYPKYIRIGDSPVPFLPLKCVDDGVKINISASDVDNAYMYGINTYLPL